MIVVRTGFIPLSPLSIHWFNDCYVGKQPLALEEYCAGYWPKELLESMDRCTGCHDVTDILLIFAFNTMHSINCSIKPLSPEHGSNLCCKWSETPNKHKEQ